MTNRIKLEKEIKEYCELNGIKDIPGFITQCILKGFNIFKYGTSPIDNIKKQNGEVVDEISNRKAKDKKKEVVIDKPIESQAKKEEIKVEEQPKENLVVKKRRKITIINNNNQ